MFRNRKIIKGFEETITAFSLAREIAIELIEYIVTSKGNSIDVDFYMPYMNDSGYGECEIRRIYKEDDGSIMIEYREEELEDDDICVLSANELYCIIKELEVMAYNKEL